MPVDRTDPAYAHRRTQAFTAATRAYRRTEKGKARKQRVSEARRFETAALKDPSILDGWSEEDKERFLTKAKEKKAVISARMKRYAKTEKGKAAQERHAEYLRKRRQQQKMEKQKAERGISGDGGSQAEQTIELEEKVTGSP